MSWKDSLKKAGLAMVTGGLSEVAGARAQMKLAKEGTPGRAVCVEFRQRWDEDEGTPKYGASEMTLDVTPEVGEPFEWSGEMWVRVTSYRKLPGELKGASIPVRIDRADKTKVAVDWDAVEAEAARA
jgi:hypothetical protein